MKFGVGPQCLVAMNNATHYSVVKTQAFCYTVVVVLTIIKVMKLACFGAVLGGKGMRTGSITCADDGTFAVVLDLDTSQVYVEVDHSYMTSVGAGGFPAVRMDLDKECSKHTIYESVFVDSSETGHPPIDPYGGGGWGVPHFD
eukprot:gene9321-12747_t